MMAKLKRIEIGLGAAKTVVCLVTLLTAAPAFARTSSTSSVRPEPPALAARSPATNASTVARR